MESSLVRNSIRLPPVAGVKRSQPAALLPPFEENSQHCPFSSSPTLPRPSKRLARISPSEQDAGLHQYLITPVPTSSTGIIPSSPQLPPLRPNLQRTQSTISERAPLSHVPTVTLARNGDPILMGRSGKSSHYRLSANPLISRVHLRASYIPAIPLSQKHKVEILCVGHNGVKVHCQGTTWELTQGDSFTSETEHADIMLDVHTSRVLISWPQGREDGSGLEELNTTYDDESPSRVAACRRGVFNSSPPPRLQRLLSPVSPISGFPSSSTFIASEATNHNLVKVYEDGSSSHESDGGAEDTKALQSTQQASQEVQASSQTPHLSALGEPQEDFADQDEENDPIIHSFGPFGDNILPRMASFSATDHSESRNGTQALNEAPQSPQSRSSSESGCEVEMTPVANHVVNQLAYSRLSSTPLSTIMNNLPVELRVDSSSPGGNKQLSSQDLRRILDGTTCVGEVSREGKDAAGKPLESEYYYVPDLDQDENRKNAVVDGLRKPGLRACRKQHKQYYWKKPKKP
ncbi:MAG: hypothetical protein M1812_004068 [Candelaria pacifica]|nr:MAG: hypothetical protein M1812_004068 [Candelaria pacifica]